MYDFSRCKLCGQFGAAPRYTLPKTTVYECPDCCFHFIDQLDEMPSPADEGGLNDTAIRFIETMIPANERQHRKNVRFVTSCLPVSGAECLDIGAGAGVFLGLLRKAGASVSGIEPQGVFREYARKKLGVVLRGEPVEDPYWQNYSAGIFELVTLWDVLEHVNFPVETLSDTYRLLQPGGWLFLDTPCRDSLFYRLSDLSYRLSGGTKTAMLESLYSPLPFRHKHLFTRSQLMDLLDRLGFVVKRVRASSFTPQNKIVMACRKRT